MIAHSIPVAYTNTRLFCYAILFIDNSTMLNTTTKLICWLESQIWPWLQIMVLDFDFGRDDTKSAVPFECNQWNAFLAWPILKLSGASVMWISFVGRRTYKLINWTGDMRTETVCSYFITELFETETDDLQVRQRGRYNEGRKIITNYSNYSLITSLLEDTTTLFVSGKMKKFHSYKIVSSGIRWAISQIGCNDRKKTFVMPVFVTITKEIEGKNTISFLMEIKHCSTK